MDRRGFLKLAAAMVPLSGGFSMIPRGMGGHRLTFSGTPFSVRTWETTFQDKVQKGKTVDAINESVGTMPNERIYPGEGVGKGIDANIYGLYNNFRGDAMLKGILSGSIAKTKFVELLTNTGHDPQGQLFEKPETGSEKFGIFRGPVRTDGKTMDNFLGDVYAMKDRSKWNYGEQMAYCWAPEFSYMIANQTYYCHGSPCTDPFVKKCYRCHQEYVAQGFYYDGNNILDGGKKYTAGHKLLLHNIECSDPRPETHGLHDLWNFPIKDLDICYCSPKTKVIPD